MTRYVWNDATGNNDWNTAGNWSPGGGPPGAGDVAQFGALNSVIAGNAMVGQLQVIAATSIEFTAAVTALGLPGVADAVQVGGGARVYFGAGASLAAGATLDVGLAGGRSVLSFQGASLTTQLTLIGSAAGSEGSISLVQSFWQGARPVVVGQAGAGELSVGQGATVILGSRAAPQAGKLVLGLRAGSSGVLSVSDGGYLSTTSDVWVGGRPGTATHGTGVISVATAGVLTAGGTLALAAGSTASLAGGYLSGTVVDIAAGALVSGSGQLSAGAALHNDGTIQAFGQLFIDGPVDGGGSLVIAAGGSLVLLQPVFAQAAIQFGAGSTLNLGQNPTVDAPLVGFAPGDTILATYADHVRFDAATDVLTLYTGQQPEGTLTLTGDYTGAVFHDAYRGSQGAITVTLPPHSHG